MANVSSSSSSGGVGFVGALTLVFIVLKLIGVIDWGWLWILSPIWISFSLVVFILGSIFTIFYLLDKKQRRNK